MNKWKDIIQGDKDAFLAVYKEYFNFLFSIGYSFCRNREKVKDCLQEVFLELWSKRDSLNPEVTDIKSYLATWVKRKILHQPKEQITEYFDEAVMNTEDAKDVSYEELLIDLEEDEQKKEVLKHALASLTRQQLRMIRLLYYENLSYQDIATIENLTIRTVYNTVHAAICRLRSAMDIEP